MFKPAVFAAAALACAPLVWGSTTLQDPAAPAGTQEIACHASGSTLDTACPLRSLADAADTAPLALALADPAEVAVGRPVGTGIDFKDAALAPATILASTHEHDGRKPLVPALFALLAMVILLSRRPTSF